MNEPQFVQKDWGWELWFANNDKYCGKELFVKYLTYSSKGNYHYHKIKDETFYVIIGKLKLDYVEDGKFKTIILQEGNSFRLTPNIKHRFCGLDPVNGCHFIEASTHHDEADSYRCYYDKENNQWVDVENAISSGPTQIPES